MSHRDAGSSSPTSKVKTKEGAPYRIERRTKKKRGGGQLSGYALDITIRVNGEEAYFLEDHNSTRNVMPHNDRKELVQTLLDELERNHAEHFGRP
ncbi:MAG: hypothetical protein WBM00_08330 [Solirubrobacterales bacterium]